MAGRPIGRVGVAQTASRGEPRSREPALSAPWAAVPLLRDDTANDGQQRYLMAMSEYLPAPGLPVPSPPTGDGASGQAAPTRWRDSDAPEQVQEGGVDLARYLGALRRFKWMVLGATVAGLAVGVVLYRRARPLYEAQATIWVESQPDRNATDQGPIQQSQLLGARGWTDLLTSYVVLDHAVREARLYLTTPPGVDSTLFAGFTLKDRFRPGRYRLSVGQGGRTVTLTANGAVVERAASGDSIGRALGFNWAPPAGVLRPGLRVDFGVANPRDAASALADRLVVSMNERGNFLKLTLDGSNPQSLAATLNALIERYVDVADQLKKDKITELVKILQDQLDQAGSKLKVSEGLLQEFRVKTITLPSDRATPVAAGLAVTQDPVLTNYFDMKIQLGQVQRDRAAIQRALAAAPDSGLSADELEGIQAVQQSPDLTAALKELTDKRAELRALRYRYTDQTAPVRDLMASIDTLERHSIPAIAQGVIDALSAKEQDLSQRVASASQELQQIPPRSIEEARLQRDVEIAGNLYTTLQQRYESARLAEASSVPDVRILDRAVVPDRPIKNRGMQLLLAGLMGGIALGVGGALARERFDRRVRYPEQVTTGLGLPILGVVPFYRGGDAHSAIGSLPVVEAIRGVRLNVRHAYGAAGPIVLTVTSPGPGDGKSFVASNLALSFAHAGHRTLLIDGDSRRGSLPRVLGGQRRPGLTDLLAAHVTLEAALNQTQYEHLRFIGCGSGMPNAPELLGSAVMVRVLTDLRSSYDVIVVDSPPLSAGVDAYALGTATGNLVLVVRTGATDRQLAGAKLEVLDRLPIRILGAVVNGVMDWTPYQYHSYYLPGYESVEDAGRADVGVIEQPGDGA